MGAFESTIPRLGLLLVLFSRSPLLPHQESSKKENESSLCTILVSVVKWTLLGSSEACFVLEVSSQMSSLLCFGQKTMDRLDWLGRPALRLLFFCLFVSGLLISVLSTRDGCIYTHNALIIRLDSSVFRIFVRNVETRPNFKSKSMYIGGMKRFDLKKDQPIIYLNKKISFAAIKSFLSLFCRPRLEAFGFQLRLAQRVEHIGLRASHRFRTIWACQAGPEFAVLVSGQMRSDFR